MKKTLQIALAATFFAGCASTSVTSSTSKGNNELVQNQLFKIEKIIVNGKTFDPKNAEESPNISFENNKFYGYSGCNRFFHFIPLNLKLVKFAFEIMTHYF